AVEHDVDLVAHGPTHLADQLHIARNPVRSVGRPVTEETLHRAITLAGDIARPLGHPAGLDRVPQGAGVGRNFGARRPAEKTIDRRLVVVAPQVPERTVDGAHGHHVDALATVD